MILSSQNSYAIFSFRCPGTHCVISIANCVPAQAREKKERDAARARHLQVSKNVKDAKAAADRGDDEPRETLSTYQSFKSRIKSFRRNSLDAIRRPSLQPAANGPSGGAGWSGEGEKTGVSVGCFGCFRSKNQVR